MTGTFASLNIAKTGLQYQQIAIDVADNNISNVNTAGYVRESANAVDAGGVSGPTMWSSYPGYGEGVATEGVQRLSDLLLGQRQRTEHGTQSLLEAQQSSLSRFESAIGEPGDDGVSAALSTFSASLQDLANNPGDVSARESVVSNAQTLAQAIQAQSAAVADEASEDSAGVTTDVTQINALAKDVASLNKSIFAGSQSGNDVANLEDQRDQDVLQLAELAGATTTVQADGRYAVSIGGVALVNVANSSVPGSGDSANALVASPVSGVVDGSTLTFSVNDASGDPIEDGSGNPVNVSVTSGDLGGLSVLLNTTLPTYYQGLNKIAYDLATTVNNQQANGYDENGLAGSPLFTAGGEKPTGPTSDATGSGYSSTTDYAANLAVVDGFGAAQLAASTTLDASGTAASLAGDNADELSTAFANVTDQYQSLVSGLGSQINALNHQTTNQQALTTQVDSEWQQSAGVSLDEETINLMSAQRAYQASAKVLSVMDDVLSTLINMVAS